MNRQYVVVLIVLIAVSGFSSLIDPPVVHLGLWAVAWTVPVSGPASWFAEEAGTGEHG